MRKSHNQVEGVPAAVGPYSIAVSATNLLFTSGQLPLDPATGALVGDTVAQQAKQVLENLKAIVEKLGSNMEDLVKVSVYLTDMGAFSEFNDVYAGYFKKNYPARSCVEVSKLPKGAQIEIEAVAFKR